MPITNVPTLSVPTGCGSCPDVILGLITDDVYQMLDKVRRAKRVVTAINRYSSDAFGLLVAELRRVLDLIPEPPQFDLRLMTGMFTCPLSPQALIIEKFDTAFTAAQRAANGIGYPDGRLSVFTTALSTELSNVSTMLTRPRDALVTTMRIIEGFARRLRELFKNIIDDLSTDAHFGFVRLFYRLADELRTTFRDADEYLLKLAVTVGSVAMVRITCPAIYTRLDLPFQAFDDEASSFSFDGVLPSGFEGARRELMEVFMLIHLKIARWQSASFLVVA